MENMIQVGHSKEVVDAIGDKVIELLKVSFETHMEQKTIRAALRAVSSSLGDISNTAISGCTFTQEADNKPEAKPSAMGRT